MSEEAARQRITSQAPQDEKLSVANVVIRNDSSFEDTWRQVVAAWQKHIPSVLAETGPLQPATAAPGQLLVEKARPRQAAEIAGFITRISGGARRLSPSDIMAAFGEKAFILLKANNQAVGIVGWQVENLVARTDDVYLEAGLSLEKAMGPLLEEVESASRDLLCEASLLFLPTRMAQQIEVWRNLGYEARSVENLGVRAWQEAAQETLAGGEVMLFKQLRKDRILRPV